MTLSEWLSSASVLGFNSERVLFGWKTQENASDVGLWDLPEDCWPVSYRNGMNVHLVEPLSEWPWNSGRVLSLLFFKKEFSFCCISAVLRCIQTTLRVSKRALTYSQSAKFLPLLFKSSVERVLTKSKSCSPAALLIGSIERRRSGTRQSSLTQSSLARAHGPRSLKGRLFCGHL